MTKRELLERLECFHEDIPVMLEPAHFMSADGLNHIQGVHYEYDPETGAKILLKGC